MIGTIKDDKSSISDFIHCQDLPKDTNFSGICSIIQLQLMQTIWHLYTRSRTKRQTKFDVRLYKILFWSEKSQFFRFLFNSL